ncbi:hypothetical protein B0G93_1185 [Bacillus sp. V-88]|nr:hypothetical protein B0G93_1185 [Bacillus sp. V-88]SLK23963.1 hypothetical protein SAMN06295884_1185 [Bacillus sp. V-88]
MYDSMKRTEFSIKGSIIEYGSYFYGGRYMKNGLVLVVVLFFVLGSAMVNNMNSLSYTFKSLFYGISLTVLIVIGLVNLYRYFKRTKH